MTNLAFYCILCFAGGFLFGVFTTALVAMAGDKNKRDYDKLEEDYNALKEANARLLEKLNKKNKEKELRIDVMHCPEFDEAEQEN